MTFQLPNVPFTDLSAYSVIRDYRSTNIPQVPFASITDYLEHNGFRYFAYIISQSNIGKRYIDTELGYTLCIPKDEFLSPFEKKMIENADTYVATEILQYSTLPACIDKKDLPYYYGYGLPTSLRNQSIFLTSKDGFYNLGNAIVVGIQEKYLNKNIIVVDRLLIPPHVL